MAKGQDNPASSSGNQGPSTDAMNNPVVDPTENVMKLVQASSKRADDLSDVESKWQRRWIRSELHRIETLVDQQKDLAQLHSQHQQALDEKESARIDSIRQVDREEVAKTAAQANLAIATLAKQTTDLATTLQTQVQSTAAAAETRRTADMSEVNKRVSALELAGSASAGKQTVADPAMEALSKQVAALVQMQQSRSGERRGMGQGFQILIAGAGLILTLMTIAGVLLAVFKK